VGTYSYLCSCGYSTVYGTNYECSTCGTTGYGEQCYWCGYGDSTDNHSGVTIDCSTCNGSGERECSSCDGTGETESRCYNCSWGTVDCSTCRGYGTVNCTTCGADGNVNCTTCGADGNVSCTTCGGDGKTTKNTTCTATGCVKGKVDIPCDHELYDSHYHCPHNNNTTSTTHYICSHNTSGKSHIVN